jgi:hypothetical protein
MRSNIHRIWWIGLVLFCPSVVAWVLAFGWSILHRRFQPYLDSYGLTHMYLPFLAACLAVAVPIYMLRRSQAFRPRQTAALFGAYLFVLAAWGVADIRFVHCQISGNHCAGDPFDIMHYYGSRRFGDSHIYFTWYFLPYSKIEDPEEVR